MSTKQFLSLEGVKAKTTLGKSCIYKKMSDGSFPKNVKISARKVAWREEDILAWMNNQ